MFEANYNRTKGLAQSILDGTKASIPTPATTGFVSRKSKQIIADSSASMDDMIAQYMASSMASAPTDSGLNSTTTTKAIKGNSAGSSPRPQSDSSLTNTASAEVRAALQSASDTVGISADYMFSLAGRESNFNPNAVNTIKDASGKRLSSASGLGQFLNSTWLTNFNKYGSELGYNTKAMTKGQILSLKTNSKAAAFILAKFTKDNQIGLKNYLGYNPTGKDLYLAHFLGLGGAKTFLKGYTRNPNASAATVASNQVLEANPSIFFVNGDRSLGVRSIGSVFQTLTGKFK